MCVCFVGRSWWWQLTFGAEIEPFTACDFRKRRDHSTMVSRRRILSRSRDDLNLDIVEAPEEDVWYQRDKLFKVSHTLFLAHLYQLNRD
jgi:hypothetical protein